MLFRSRVTVAAGAALLFGSLVSPPLAIAKTDRACDLITAEGVSSIVSGKMTKDTTARSPVSLCGFANFGGGAQVSSVTVTLFTPRTMRQPSIGGVIAKVGCRNELQQCQKAVSDDSPAELYDAESRGSMRCNANVSCYLSSDSVLWAKQGNEVVAIAAMNVVGEGGAPKKYVLIPNKEIELLNSVAPHL